jgi:hypothetical protein
MGRRGVLAPPPEAGLEVLDAGRAGDGRVAAEQPVRSWGPRPGVRVVVALASVVAVAASAVLGGGVPESGPGVATVDPGPMPAPAADPTGPVGHRLERPIGHRLAALTMSGVAVLDADAGTFEHIEVGTVTSYGSRPALVAMGSDRVAVLLGDRSVWVLDLGTRSVVRIAEQANAILAGSRPGRLWVRRLVGRGQWELQQVDGAGQPLAPPLRLAGGEPPQVVDGRPMALGEGPRPLPDSGDWEVSVHERRGTVVEYDLQLTDRRSGEERWVRGLSHPPVPVPGGDRLVTGGPGGRELVALDLRTLGRESIPVPTVDGVSVDWANLVVLPPDEREPNGR